MFTVTENSGFELRELMDRLTFILQLPLTYKQPAGTSNLINSPQMNPEVQVMMHPTWDIQSFSALAGLSVLSSDEDCNKLMARDKSLCLDLMAQKKNAMGNASYVVFKPG